MSLNGSELVAGLVGGVAVPPDLRRRGHGRRLMAGLLAELRARQVPVSLLFPFSVAWYRSLGYGMANYAWRLDLPPDLLPEFPERLDVRRAGPDDESGIRDCYAASRRARANNGWLSRTDWEWENRLQKEGSWERMVYEVDGRIEGYVVVDLAWSPTESTARVMEWVWLSDAAWRGLAATLGSLSEQARLLRYNAPRHDPLLHSLREPYDFANAPVEFVFFQSARLLSGFMLRVVDLPAALRQRVYPAGVETEFVLHVEDAQIPDNNRPLHVRVAGGAAQTLPLSTDLRHPTVQIGISSFSEMYAGLVSARQLRLMGRLVADDTTCAALTAVFAAAPLHMWPADWF